MKKLFMLLAIAGVMVACGDDKKKDEKKDAQATEATAPAAGEEKGAPAVSNVDALINKAITAIENNDEAGFNALEAEYNKLSKEDQAKFEAAVSAAMGM